MILKNTIKKHTEVLTMVVGYHFYIIQKFCNILFYIRKI